MEIDATFLLPRGVGRRDTQAALHWFALSFFLGLPRGRMSRNDGTFGKYESVLAI
jgi:hypothetical protein